MTTSVGSNSSTGTNSGSSSSAMTSLTSNFNTFLTLLTTQLQNQDPLSPMDSNTFTQQLVEFSQVEQQINTNTNLQQLISLQNASESISALPIVGDTVEYNSATGPLSANSTGTGSSANWVYSLPSGTTSTQINVADSNGNVVYSTAGQTTAGTYLFNWNGESNAGVPLSNGNYTVQINATGANNSTITPTISSVGTVSAVGVNNGAASLTVSGMSVPLSELVTINPSLSSLQSN